MERTAQLKKIQNIFQEVLDDNSIVLREETTSNDIEEWDSLTHIQIVVDIEKKFNIKFSSMEILSWKNIGEMIDCINSK